MKIAVLAKDERDFKDFIHEMNLDQKATKCFVYVRSIDQIRGCYFNGVIKTDSYWKKAQNIEFYDVIIRIIKN